MIKIEVLTKDPFYLLKDTNCISIGKRAKKERTESHEEIKNYFITKILEEHSTVEWIHFRIIDDHCRGDIASHIVRQTKGHPRYVVQSSRPDWNKGEKRKPLDETFIKFVSLWTPYSFTMMTHQRLCNRASAIDRTWIKSIIKEMKKSGDPLLEAIAFCSVPNCVYKNGCTENRTCAKYTRLLKDVMTEYKYINDYRDKYDEALKDN